jgi:TonB-linked outer membrane protein, SusC/RagA family
MAQSKKITGKITDEKGNPVPNASVVVKGTKSGTSANLDGTFSLTVPAGAKTLVITSVNYATQEISIVDKQNVSVLLQSSTQNLEEVVVSTGLFKQRRTEYAGAVSSVSAKALKDKPVGSFDQILQGQVPGLLALTTSGQPGNAANVIIRGTTSIAGTSNPLYIIDGIPVEANVFQGLNPNDFESVDILKDAAVASLYGSRGSSGVIVITTKKGVNGRLKLSYDFQAGVKSKPDFAFTPMNTTQLLKAQQDYGLIAGGGASIPGWYYSKLNPRYASLTAAQQAQADYLLDSISKINTNWADYIFRNGPFSKHQLTLSGGNDKIKLYSSLELYNEKGTTFRTDMNRISFRNNIDYTGEKLNLSLTSSVAYVRRNFQQSTTTNSTQNPFLVVNIQSPYALVYNADGSYATGNGANFVAADQLDYTKYDQNYNNQLKLDLGLNGSYKLTKDLVLGMTTGLDFRETQSSTYYSKLAYLRTISSTPTTKAGGMYEYLDRFFQVDVRPYINYTKVIKDKHKITVGVFGEYIDNPTKGFGATGYGIDPRTPNTFAAVTQGNSTNQLYAVLSGYRAESSLLSGLGTATYSYDSRYSVSASFRMDGSSKLPKDNRWTSFYSVSGIWTITNEKFLQPSKNINELRLRASYGSSGDNDNFPTSYGNYGYLATWANGDYSGISTMYVSNVGNPNLKWETTYQLNIGTDFTFFSSRLRGSLDFYDKRTKNLFVNKQLSAEGGGYTILVNAGELQNKGFELDVTYDVLRLKNFVWSLNAKASYNANKILSLGGLESYTSGTSLITVGKPLGSHYEVKWAGVDAASGAPLYYKKDGKTLTTTYSADDKVQEFGTWEAPWKGGFGTSLHYKDFDLSVLFSWQNGSKKEDNLEYFVENPVGFLAGGYNQSSSLNFWKKPGDIATTPSPLYSTNFSSKLIHDASFLRLRDVTLSYAIPSQILRHTHGVISRARIFVQGSNLFIWTKWRGMDPEAGPLNINLSEYPNPRAITAGVNVTF